jgi:8-oxo-dGTP diphosphatase
MLLQVGVKALIKNSSDKYLLLQRSKIMDGETVASWDIPGGRIKPEEPLNEALARELSEEIGFNVTVEPHLITSQDIFIKAKDLHVVRLTYRVDCDIENIKISDEHTNYAWVDPSDFKELLIEPYLKEVLSSYIKIS